MQKDVNIKITKKSNCCCIHQVVNSGAQNCALNKEFELKPKHRFVFYFICNISAPILNIFQRKKRNNNL